MLSYNDAGRADWPFNTAHVPIISTEPAVAHAPARADDAPPVWSSAAQGWLADDAIISREAEVTLADDGQTSVVRAGAEYIEHLVQLFPQMLEPVAASYNGGEDNVARWLERAKRVDPGVFTAEVGFDETKGYVQKVMSNYRVYRKLYTADMIRK